MQFDQELRAEVIRQLAQEVREQYVFPEVAVRVADGLAEQSRSGAYDALATPQEFAAAVTAAMYRISGDEHLRMRFSEKPHTEPADEAEQQAQRDAYRKHCAQIAFGIERVERLLGNIGYIDIREFVDPFLAGGSIDAAMTLIAHTDALIIDLRQCVGGDPAAVALYSSYLFEHRTQLSSIVMRDGVTSEQFWTHEWVSGVRFGQTKPVFLLTAHFTFSGAENFAYDLQSLKRATVVGEKTGGGAHPGNLKWITPHFNMFVPNARSVSAITGTNWEGVGVVPDICVRKEDALQVAIERANSMLGAR